MSIEQKAREIAVNSHYGELTILRKGDFISLRQEADFIHLSLDEADNLVTAIRALIEEQKV